MPKKKPVSGISTSIYLPNDLNAAIHLRGQKRSQIISRDLQRLYSMYERALVLRIKLTPEEVLTIADAVIGLIYTPQTVSVLWQEIEDAIKIDKIDKNWNVDGRQLIEKLKNMHEFDLLAILDGVERLIHAEASFKEGCSEEDLKKLAQKIFHIG